jgi:hypothetical protein
MKGITKAMVKAARVGPTKKKKYIFRDFSILTPLPEKKKGDSPRALP